MESHDQSNLLLCDKEDLVKYIMKLKQNEEGIMDFKVRGAGLGCNSYEKFINLSAELDYSEKEMDKYCDENHELKEEIIKLQIQHHKDCIALLELRNKARGCCWTEEKEEE